jgi:hypothetical protein
MREYNGVALFLQPLDFSEQIDALQGFAGSGGVHSLTPIFRHSLGLDEAAFQQMA